MGSWRQALQAAHAAAAERNLDDREASFLDAVTTRLRSDEETGAAALLRHIRLFPRDALAVSVAVPTVAFGGLTSGRQTAAAGRGSGPHLRRRLVVRRPAGVRPPGPGALERGGGAGVVRPLGRAVVGPRRARARPRLLRDRPAHRGSGLARRLDPEPRPRGQPPLPLLLARRPARAHAVRRGRRPPTVRARARAAAGHRIPGAGRQRRPAVALPRHRHLGGRAAQPGRLRVGPRRLAAQPAHGVRRDARRALGLATEGDDVGLAALRTIAHAHHDPAFRDVVAPLCGALQQVVEGEFSEAADAARPPCSPAPVCSAAAPRSARCWRTRWSTRWPAPARASAPPRCSTSGSAAGPRRSTPVAARPSRRRRRREQRHDHLTVLTARWPAWAMSSRPAVVPAGHSLGSRLFPTIEGSRGARGGAMLIEVEGVAAPAVTHAFVVGVSHYPFLDGPQMTDAGRAARAGEPQQRRPVGLRARRLAPERVPLPGGAAEGRPAAALARSTGRR